MAIAFTIPGLQAELQTLATAVDAADWAGARRSALKAHAVLCGLPESVAATSVATKLRSDLDKMTALIGDAEEAASRSGDRRRLIRTKVAHRTVRGRG